MTNHSEYDVIVIGAGPVGENAADRAVQGGLTVAVVENELVGGECSYWACMPSKALLRPNSARRAALSVSGAKQAVTGDLDVPAVLAHRDQVAAHWDDAGQVGWLDGAGIALHRGAGRLTGVKQVGVTAADGSSTTLTARQAVVIATGTGALIPDITGLADIAPWTSREATSATTVPARFAIIGGGVVAAEMATAFNSLGSQVTMLLRDGLLARVEPFAAELVASTLADRGVTLIDEVEVTSAERTDAGGVRIGYRKGDEDRNLEADEVLVATGRRPRTDAIGLDAVGLPNGSWLTVDDTMRVLDESGSVLDGGWLYAVGDVNHRALLTHQGKYQARAAGDVIVARATGSAVDDAPWGTHVATADHAAVPQVVFTDPEIGSVGLTAAEADKAGLRVRSVDYRIGDVAGASLHAEGYTGTARIVVDRDREVIVGATFVGPDIAEMVQAATIAIVGEVPISRLWHAVPAYPTVSEIWLRLLETYGRPS
jgi:pyruvate/2-oxoglutarate dehydrogenase complex dihydrolipoamide dehydrogenase (E3) component